MNKDYLDRILSDAEKSALEYFVSNEVLKEAVKKVILTGIYGNGTLIPDEPAEPTRNFALAFAMNKERTDAEIGQDLRACVEGIRLLEIAFSNMAKYKKEEATPAKTNEAR